MAFKVFIEEKVDVAVIEVGIGGEYDCTNILRLLKKFNIKHNLLILIFIAQKSTSGWDNIAGIRSYESLR